MLSLQVYSPSRAVVALHLTTASCNHDSCLVHPCLPPCLSENPLLHWSWCFCIAAQWPDRRFLLNCVIFQLYLMLYCQLILFRGFFTFSLLPEKQHSVQSYLSNLWRHTLSDSAQAIYLRYSSFRNSEGWILIQCPIPSITHALMSLAQSLQNSRSPFTNFYLKSVRMCKW